MTTETNEVVEPVVNSELEADKNEAPDTPESTAESGDVEQKQDEPQKTFTQAEVDAVVQKRLLKEERRVHRRIEQQLREQQQSEALRVQPRREAYDDDDDFIQAQIDHRAEIKAAEKLAERKQVEAVEKRDESFAEKADKAVERYPDFWSVVSNPAVPISDDMIEFFAESDLGAEVAYYLGKNPDRVLDLRSMSPSKAARELIRIETELAARPKHTPSKAPEPITPVGQRGKGSSSALPSDDDDIDTWMKKEEARQRAR